MLDFNRPTLSIEELEATAAFKVLNAQQQMFVRTWIETGGDQVFAAAQAYQMRDPETARKGSYALMSRKSIKTVIDLFLCKTPKDIFLEEVERASRSKKTKPSHIKALELRSQLLFGTDLKSLRKEFKADARSKAGKKSGVEPEPSEGKTKNSDASAAPYDPARKYKVGDLFVYEGQAVRATEVNAAGVPTKAEPVMEISQ